MKNKLWLLSIALIVFISASFWQGPPRPACRFTALDVGQGDAILIQTTDGQDMLVDGGPSAKVVQSLSRKLGPGNREIELVVLTHPDADHITGLVAVAERLAIKQILTSQVETETQIFGAWKKVLTERQVPLRHVAAGEQYILGDMQIEILWPTVDWDKKGKGTPTNDASVSLRVTCDGGTAVMTGDASEDVEEQILQTGRNVDATLLKVGHHGSRTSSMHEFLQAVSPEIAVISVGRTNRYKHPHPTVLQRLQAVGVEVFRTDVMGEIELITDGQGGWRPGG